MGCSINSTSRKIQVQPHIKVKPQCFVKENENRFYDVYRLGKILGTGSFGEVRLCIHRELLVKRAVKIIRKDLLTSPKQRERLITEIRIMKTLDHPNIIRIFEFFEESKKLMIVMEYCKGGELITEIKKKKTINEQISACIMKKIFSVLEYLHSRNIVHRDIKPQNILLEEKHDLENIKLIDFGTALASDKIERFRSNIGSPTYIAPEVLNSDYNYLCDMWSAGVIMYYLLSGYHPFDGSPENISSRLNNLNLFCKDPWQNISQEAKDIISAMLTPEPLRITPTKALSSEWILKNSSDQVESSKITEVLLNLKNFRSCNLLKDAIKTYITTQYISNSDIKDFKDIFALLDKDHDGKISKDELISEYRKVFNEKEVKHIVDKIMTEVDLDQNGFIDYSEFLRANVDSLKIINEGNLKSAFSLFDSDGTGKISPEEIGRVLEGETANSYLWNKLVEEFDVNGDGKIDLEEFEMLLKIKSEGLHKMM